MRLQPATATRPPRASTATTSRSPSARRTRARGIGEASAAVPTTTRAAPASRSVRGVGKGADPARGLDRRRRRGGGERTDELGPDRGRTGAVEVDDVDERRRVPPRTRDEARRLARPGDDGVERALPKADRLLADHVDRRHQLEAVMLPLPLVPLT